jgi:hypothetical protein
MSLFFWILILKIRFIYLKYFEFIFDFLIELSDKKNRKIFSLVDELQSEKENLRGVV